METTFTPMIMTGIVGAIYFLPVIIGRNKKNSKAIFVLNLFLGWTFIGWIIALIWATTKD